MKTRDETTIEIEKRLIGKTLVIFILTVALALIAGIFIGRHTGKGEKILPENELKDRLYTCRYKIEELTHKYEIKQRALQRLLRQQSTEEKVSKTTQNSANDMKKPQQMKEKPIKKKTAPLVRHTAEQHIAAKDQPDRSTVEKAEELQQKRQHTEVQQQKSNKTTARPLSPQKKEKKACVYAIQLFSDTNKENARKALAHIVDLKARLETATIRGKQWYRIRYGCFEKKTDAVEALNHIRGNHAKAIIVVH